MYLCGMIKTLAISLPMLVCIFWSVLLLLDWWEQRTVFLYILVPVDNLHRDEEEPTGESAPDDCRNVVAVLYLKVASEEDDTY